MPMARAAATKVTPTSTQKGLVGMSKAPTAKPMAGTSHPLLRANAAVVYHTPANVAISSATGKDRPSQLCTVLVEKVRSYSETVIPHNRAKASRGHSHVVTNLEEDDEAFEMIVPVLSEMKRRTITAT